MIVMKKQSGTELCDTLIRALPREIIFEYEKLSTSLPGGEVEEIRFSLNKYAELVAFRERYALEYITDERELSEIVYALCENSIYAHADTIREGYIRLRGGYRVGVCGRAVTEDGKIKSVYGITSVNIRIPKRNLPSFHQISQRLENRKSALILSPPGVGKTTVLRSVTAELSSKYGRRIAVVDSRGELSFGLSGKDMRCDILEEYPREKGIEIAVRTLSPDLIVCDEIGTHGDLLAICDARLCGVPIIATSHGESVERVLMKKELLELHRKSVFDYYIPLSRKKGSGKCDYEIIKREEVLLDL